MLNEYFELQYEKQKKASAAQHIQQLLMQLPNEELIQMANGDFSKMASLEDRDNWISQFKGTPFFEQACALEQEELQLDMQNNAKRQEEAAESGQRDAIRIRKRLLEIQVAQEEQGAVEEAAMAEQAAALQPAPEEAAPEEKKEPKVEKTTVETKTGSALFVEEAGRALARSDFEKIAFGAGLRALGGTALNALKANPAAAIGTAAGAAGGLVHGLQKDEHGNRSILRGVAHGAVGGALGGAAGHSGALLRNNLKAEGATLGSALKATGSQLRGQASSAYNTVKGTLKKAPAAAAEAAPAAATQVPTQLTLPGMG